MRFLFYTHSLRSDWNHGNAHFLRGVMRDLVDRGHRAVALEPADCWSRENLVRHEGTEALDRFHRDFPELETAIYDDRFCHEAAVDAADVVVVHEWTDPALVEKIGRLRREQGGFVLLFHDTHHRAVTASNDIRSLCLDNYDGVLAFGEALAECYKQSGWDRDVHVWHEAADDVLFRPLDHARTDNVVWIGNWGDEERSAELGQFLIEPVRQLGCGGTVHGVRYPAHALEALAGAGLTYRGWLANADVPSAFASHRLTLHIPRRPYVEALPGIPTIRVFEALACGIPLICSPWEDAENLFRPGQDYLVAHDPDEMFNLMIDVLYDHDLAQSLAGSGLETIRARHTCRHRVDELLAIADNYTRSGVDRPLAFPEAAQ